MKLNFLREEVRRTIQAQLRERRLPKPTHIDRRTSEREPTELELFEREIMAERNGLMTTKQKAALAEECTFMTLAATPEGREYNDIATKIRAAIASAIKVAGVDGLLLEIAYPITGLRVPYVGKEGQATFEARFFFDEDTTIRVGKGLCGSDSTLAVTLPSCINDLPVENFIRHADGLRGALYEMAHYMAMCFATAADQTGTRDAFVRAFPPAAKITPPEPLVDTNILKELDRYRTCIEAATGGAKGGGIVERGA